jgi:hypothetical protein
MVPSLKKICLRKKYIFLEAKKMTTSIVNQIAELILSDVKVTTEVLQDQLRSLLALKMVLVPDALIHCLSDIVIRRRKQRTLRLPSAVNVQVSRYLFPSDAGKYLVGTNLSPGQIKIQMERRLEQREKEYQKLIKDGKYSSWEALIREEHREGRMSFDRLIRFITAQNIPDEIRRSVLWTNLIIREYKKGRMSFKELKHFITAQNIPEKVVRSTLWDILIEEEYKRGRTLKELKPFITPQNIPNRDDDGSITWEALIREEYRKGRTLKELIPFITAQNIPDEMRRSVLWRSLIEEEIKKGRYVRELKTFITVQNIPNKVIRYALLKKILTPFLVW